MFGRLNVTFIVVSLAVLLFAQSAEAVKGPRITNKVSLKIKYGREDYGDSEFHVICDLTEA